MKVKYYWLFLGCFLNFFDQWIVDLISIELIDILRYIWYKSVNKSIFCLLFDIFFDIIDIGVCCIRRPWSLSLLFVGIDISWGDLRLQILCPFEIPWKSDLLSDRSSRCSYYTVYLLWEILIQIPFISRKKFFCFESINLLFGSVFIFFKRLFELLVFFIKWEFLFFLGERYLFGTRKCRRFFPIIGSFFV